jgi:hypothetical protein
LSLDVNRMQRLVDAALDNAVANGFPINADDLAEAEDLMHCDADIEDLADREHWSLFELGQRVTQWKRTRDDWLSWS